MRVMLLMAGLLLLGACAGRGAIDDVAAAEFGAAGASWSSRSRCDDDRREPRKRVSKAPVRRTGVNW